MQVADRIAARPVPMRRGDDFLLSEARNGHLPAEALPTLLRHQLVRELHNYGWTDLEIADHTRMTLYTAARIRDFLRLRPNRPRAEELSA